MQDHVKLSTSRKRKNYESKRPLAVIDYILENANTDVRVNKTLTYRLDLDLDIILDLVS